MFRLFDHIRQKDTEMQEFAREFSQFHNSLKESIFTDKLQEMRFEKGKSGNPQGRPKGAKGNIPQTVKEAISEALESRSEQIATKLDAVTDPVKWLELYAKFAVFIIPKNSKVETVGEFDDWTSEELEAEVKRMHTEAGMKLVPIED